MQPHGHERGRARDRREEGLRHRPQARIPFVPRPEAAGLCREFRADGIWRRRDLRLPGARPARSRFRAQIRAAGDARSCCRRMPIPLRFTIGDEAYTERRHALQLGFPRRARRCPRPSARRPTRLEALGAGERHDRLSPARLGRFAPALLGLPDPGHPLRHLRHRAGAGKRPAGDLARGCELRPAGQSAGASSDLEAHRPAPLAAGRPSARPTRSTRSSNRPGTSRASARRARRPRSIADDGRLLAAGRSVYRRHRACGAASALFALLHPRARRTAAISASTEPFAGLFTQGMVCHETYRDEAGNWLFPEEVRPRRRRLARRARAARHRRPHREDVEIEEERRRARGHRRRLRRRHGAAVSAVATARPSATSNGPMPASRAPGAMSTGCGALPPSRRRRCRPSAAQVPRDLPPALDALRRQSIARSSPSPTISTSSASTAAVARMPRADQRDRGARRDEARRARCCARRSRSPCGSSAPMMPHLAEELWHALGHGGSWPTSRGPRPIPRSRAEEPVTLAVQVNGKLRGTVDLPRDADERRRRRCARSRCRRCSVRSRAARRVGPSSCPTASSMSWSSFRALAALVLLPLASCGFHPLYSERSPIGYDPDLAAIDVRPRTTASARFWSPPCASSSTRRRRLRPRYVSPSRSRWRAPISASGATRRLTGEISVDVSLSLNPDGGGDVLFQDSIRTVTAIRSSERRLCRHRRGAERARRGGGRTRPRDRRACRHLRAPAERGAT